MKPKPFRQTKPQPKQRIQKPKGTRGRKGLKQRELGILQKLQERDLGEAKTALRLWKLRHEPRLNKLVSSLPPEFASQWLKGRLVNPKMTEGALKELNAVKEKIGSNKFYEIVELIFKCPNIWVPKRAVWALNSSDNIGFLEKTAASNPDSLVRADAVLVLDSLRSVGSVPLLESIAKNDSDFIVRTNARFALRNFRKNSRGKKK